MDKKTYTSEMVGVRYTAFSPLVVEYINKINNISSWGNIKGNNGM